MGSAALLLQMPSVPRVALLLLALPLVLMMAAALVALLAIAGRRAWRVLLVLLLVPLSLLIVFGSAFMVKRTSYEAGDRPEVKIDRQIQELERRTAELRKVRERLNTPDGNQPGEPVVRGVPHGAMAQQAAEAPGDAAPPAEDSDPDPGTPPAAAEVAPEDDFSEVPTIEPIESEPAVSDRDLPDDSFLAVADSSRPRPTWVDSPAIRAGKVHTAPVVIGPYTTLKECQQLANREIETAIAGYNDWYLKQHGGRHDLLLVRAPEYTSNWTKPDHCYRQVIQSRRLNQKMHRLHVLLQFSDDYRQQLDSCWSQTVVARRLTRVALASGAVLALLATLYLYLRLDLATKGCYTGRLQCAVAGAILALVASGALLARWIPWLYA